MPERPTVVFSPQAVLALPHLVTDCEGVLLKGNRDRAGHAQVLCSFCPGNSIRSAPLLARKGPFAVVLSPPSPGLARELERAAEDAEEQ
jgi:hypothetical protein